MYIVGHTVEDSCKQIYRSKKMKGELRIVHANVSSLKEVLTNEVPGVILIDVCSPKKSNFVFFSCLPKILSSTTDKTIHLTNIDT